MVSLDDVMSAFPTAEPCCGELIANLDGKNVVLGHFGNDSFVLSAEGKKRLETAEPVAVKQKRGRSKEAIVAEAEPVQ